MAPRRSLALACGQAPPSTTTRRPAAWSAGRCRGSSRWVAAKSARRTEVGAPSDEALPATRPELAPATAPARRRPTCWSTPRSLKATKIGGPSQASIAAPSRGAVVKPAHMPGERHSPQRRRRRRSAGSPAKPRSGLGRGWWRSGRPRGRTVGTPRAPMLQHRFQTSHPDPAARPPLTTPTPTKRARASAGAATVAAAVVAAHPMATFPWRPPPGGLRPRRTWQPQSTTPKAVPRPRRPPHRPAPGIGSPACSTPPHGARREGGSPRRPHRRSGQVHAGVCGDRGSRTRRSRTAGRCSQRSSTAEAGGAFQGASSAAAAAPPPEGWSPAWSQEKPGGCGTAAGAAIASGAAAASSRLATSRSSRMSPPTSRANSAQAESHRMALGPGPSGASAAPAPSTSTEAPSSRAPAASPVRGGGVTSAPPVGEAAADAIASAAPAYVPKDLALS